MPRGFEIDWVIVRVHNLQRAVAVIATLAVAIVLLVVAYRLLNQPPDVVARRAIEAAERVRQRALSQDVPDLWQEELLGAAAQLDTARERYGQRLWSEATSEARSARQRFELVLGGTEQEIVGAAQILSLDGRVGVQRAGSVGWSDGHERMPLFTGDFVRTGAEGSAEILFADGTLYRVAPDSLLEIQREGSSGPAVRASDGGEGEVRVRMGRINVYTSTNRSTVVAEELEAEVDTDSRVAVGVEEDSTATVAAYQGRASVRSDTGGRVRLTANQGVTARPGRGLGTTEVVPMAPVLLEPPPNRVFELGRTGRIGLAWRSGLGARAALLQVSRDKQFPVGRLDVDADGLTEETAVLRPVLPGAYFWRVASVGEGGLRSEWSPTRRFRIVAQNRSPLLVDSEPPELVLESSRQMGELFILDGRTEPGATVTINGEPVETGADGRFTKAVEAPETGETELVVVAVDPAGNRTERTERVYVEVY